ncbi:hypothetical protein THIOM_005589 [Candidatus Thiomargarita nelsonii]|uniref:Uncharacterized protein n=1 Tax=Candidatus Thiomargarita nelsonii TaxID=1003181 RepID=A0A176RST5_9GAMM|nr:hypothetical protein THIOM_005589 [Candidatus Thiomargarita nelsonii]
MISATPLARTEWCATTSTWPQRCRVARHPVSVPARRSRRWSNWWGRYCRRASTLNGPKWLFRNGRLAMSRCSFLR